MPEDLLNILFWDIDGTLVKTSKSGLYAFDQAAREIWKQGFDFEQVEAAGMTDNYIAAQIIELITGRSATPDEVEELTRRYEKLLPAQLYGRGGVIMPSVREILDALDDQDDFLCLLLTGNSRAGSEIKLKYFELDYYFDFRMSAFCDTYYNRVDIAKCAAAALAKVRKDMSTSKIFVVGDTPNDIKCGKAINAYTIGVATGRFSVGELESGSPWWAVETLPQPEVFMEKLRSVTAGNENAG